MGFKFSVCRQLLHLLQTKLYYNQQCLALTTEASPTLCVHPVIPDSELKMIKVTHIAHQDRATLQDRATHQDRATPALYTVRSMQPHATPCLSQHIM